MTPCVTAEMRTPTPTAGAARLPGNVSVVTAPLPAQQWPHAVTYEWGATITVLFLQRICQEGR